jgi:hypothetical protein
VAGAGGAASSLPDLIKTSYDRQQLAQLDALQAKKRAGTLGLTEEERRLMESRLSGAAQAQAAASNAQQRSLLAGSGASSGAALLGAQQAAEQAAKAREAVAAQVEEKNYLAKQQQLDEMAALQAAIAEKKARQLGALGSILGAGVEAAATTVPQSKFITPSADLQALQGRSDAAVNEQQVISFADKYQLAPDKARTILEAIRNNPELLQTLQAQRGK